MKSVTKLEKWLAKFAFPKINTKSTHFMLVDSMTYRLPRFPKDHVFTEDISYELDIEVLRLSRYRYNGKRRNAEIIVAYSGMADICLILR